MYSLKVTDVFHIIAKRPLMVAAVAIPCAVIGALVPIALEPRAYQATEVIQVKPNAALIRSELNDMEVVLKQVRSEITTPLFEKHVPAKVDASSTSDPFQVNLVVRSSTPKTAIQYARIAGNYFSSAKNVIPNAVTVEVTTPANIAVKTGYTLRGNLERGFLGLLIGLLVGIATAKVTGRKASTI